MQVISSCQKGAGPRVCGSPPPPRGGSSRSIFAACSVSSRLCGLNTTHKPVSLAPIGFQLTPRLDGYSSKYKTTARFSSCPFLSLVWPFRRWSFGPRSAGSQGVPCLGQVHRPTKSTRSPENCGAGQSRHEADPVRQDRASRPADLLGHIRRHTHHTGRVEIDCTEDCKSTPGLGRLPHHRSLGMLRIRRGYWPTVPWCRGLQNAVADYNGSLQFMTVGLAIVCILGKSSASRAHSCVVCGV